MAEELVRRQLRVINPAGLHARPAAQLARLAIQFQSRIELIKEGLRVDAKSIIDLMTLAAAEGTELVLEVRGSDSQAAADAIEKLFLEMWRDADADPDASDP
jgi:phosphocarrier protein